MGDSSSAILPRQKSHRAIIKGIVSEYITPNGQAREHDLQDVHRIM